MISTYGIGALSNLISLSLHNFLLRLLTEKEGKEFTDCLKYVPTPAGNLINEDTKWNINGSFIKKISLSESDILCTDRTLLIPVRYRTIQDATSICEELGEKGIS